MRQLHVGHALPVAISEGFQLALIQHFLNDGFGSIREKGSYRRFGGGQPLLLAGCFCQGVAMAILDHEKTAEELVLLRTALDRQKVNDLDKEPRVAPAITPDDLDQRLKARNESLVSDAKQGSAWDIANPGGFDDDGPGAPLCKAAVPVQIVFGDKSILGGPPGNHGRDPGPALQGDRPDSNGSEQQGVASLLFSRPARIGDSVANWIRVAPHGK